MGQQKDNVARLVSSIVQLPQKSKRTAPFLKSVKLCCPTHLPRCQHGNALSDWAGDWLQPSCGCNFDNTSDQNQKAMAFLKLKLSAL